jgi:hypothetical protein
MKKLSDLIAILESKIAVHELINSSISKGSVGWHIEHTLLTFNTIIEALKKSDPANYKSRFDYRRLYVLLLGKIPRGKVKAPAVVQPKEDHNVDTLQQHISISKQNLKSLEDLQPSNFFTHPFLGDMNLKQAIRFLQVHTSHHVHIIDDIVRSKPD